MLILSPFQLLPPHVVKVVVNHVVGSSRLHLDGVDSGSLEYKKPIYPLLRVCLNFRAVAHPLYYQSCGISLDVRANKVYIYEYSRTTYASYLNYPVRHLTREIQIRVYVNDIYDGPALQLLSADPCDGCAFPQARELTFYLVTECSYDDDDGRLPPDTDTNILAFVQRIKEMAPLVSKVYLCISDMDGYVVTSSSKNMRFLLSNLSKLTKTTLFANGCAQLMAYLDLAQICKLVHIDFQIKEDSTTRTAYRSDTPDY